MAGMIGRLFGRKGGNNRLKPGPQLAMPAFRGADVPSAEAIGEAWRELFPDHPPPQVTEKDESGGNAVGVIRFDAGDRSVMFAFIDMPIPSTDIDAACKVSWMWDEAAGAMKSQKSHAIVAAVPDEDAVGAALAVSRIIAAACEAGGAVGVYWGNCAQVHKPEFFIDAVQSVDDDGALPVMLWVATMVSGSSARGPYTLSTHGMHAFGHREFEIIDAHDAPGDLRMRVYGVIDYVLRSGPVLMDGNTIGDSETERIKVEHTTSRFRKGEPVIRLHVP